MKFSKLTKILSLILALTTLLALTACGGETTGTPDPVINQEALDEYNKNPQAQVYGSFASEVEALYDEEHPEESAEESNVKNEYDITYLSWTYYEWATGKESEKDKCAQAYLGYIGDLLGLKVTDTDLSSMEQIKESLGKALKNNEELSVQEIVLYFYAGEESKAAE